MAFWDFMNLGGTPANIEDIARQRAAERGYGVGGFEQGPPIPQALMPKPQATPGYSDPGQGNWEDMAGFYAPQAIYGTPAPKDSPSALAAPAQAPPAQSGPRIPMMFGAPPPFMQGEDQSGTASAGLPPSRPSAASPTAPANVPAANAAPAGPATPAAPAAKPGEDGFWSKFMRGLSNNSDELIYLGAGLASSPRWGEGLIKGMTAANAAGAGKTKAALEQLKLARETQGIMGQVDWLMKNHGMSREQAMGVAMNPSAMAKLYESKLGKDDTPKVQEVTDPNTGQRRSIAVTSGGIRPLTDAETGAAPVDPNAPPIPAGADAAEVRKQRAQAAVTREGEQLERGRVAQEMAPHLQRAFEAYDKLSKNGSVTGDIGPLSASSANRFFAGMAGTNAEKLRQEYEAAAKNLELTQAQLKMKGQGAVTESERKILQLTLPRLDAADPATGLKTLKDMYDLAQREYSAAQTGTNRMKTEQFPSLTGGPRLPQGVTIRRVN